METLPLVENLFLKGNGDLYMLKNFLFEHVELMFRPTNMFNPDFTVNCLKSRDS